MDVMEEAKHKARLIAIVNIRHLVDESALPDKDKLRLDGGLTAVRSLLNTDFKNFRLVLLELQKDLRKCFPNKEEALNLFFILFNDLLATTDKDGNKVWLDAKGRRHNSTIDGTGMLCPAVVKANGRREWWNKGEPFIRTDADGKMHPIKIDDEESVFQCGDFYIIQKKKSYTLDNPCSILIEKMEFADCGKSLMIKAKDVSKETYTLSCNLIVFIN